MNHNLNFISYYVTTYRWHRSLKYLLVEYKGHVLYSPYHSCWWPDDARGQGKLHPWYWLIFPGIFRILRQNSLWPSDARWRRRSESTLAQIMACCLMAPSRIQWICYERSFSEFYLSIWYQLVFNQRLQLFVQSPQPYLLIFAWRN